MQRSGAQNKDSQSFLFPLVFHPLCTGPGPARDARTHLGHGVDGGAAGRRARGPGSGGGRGHKAGVRSDGGGERRRREPQAHLQRPSASR